MYNQPKGGLVSSTQDNFAKRPTKRGKISKFSIEDQVLIFLEYYKENRTFFHIGTTYGVHESTIYRIVTKIGNTSNA
jgi:Helix-turn-helix of DDE superfamily endonuclease